MPECNIGYGSGDSSETEEDWGDGEDNEEMFWTVIKDEKEVRWENEVAQRPVAIEVMTVCSLIIINERILRTESNFMSKINRFVLRFIEYITKIMIIK